MTDITMNSHKKQTMTSVSALRALVPDTRVSGLMVGGFMVLAVGFGGMTAWATLAPLHSAVMASGALAPETGRKTVKHTETAQIDQVLVKEGDKVKAGQVLMRLDSTEAATRLEVLTTNWIETMALEARLTAELFEKPSIEWPDDLSQRRGANRTVDKLMANQEKLFNVRRSQLDSEARLTKERIATLAEEVSSLEGQREFLAREIALSDENVKINEGLLTKGNATRTKLVEQQKELARLMGRDHELEARIAQSKQSAVDAEGDLTRRRNDFREKVLTDLEKARGDIVKLAEQIRDAANRLDSRSIKAPDTGTVVMHGHWTAGGTITANEPVMDIIPDEQALLAEVKVQPKDIKSLTVDLPVKMQLTAYDNRIVGHLDGTVTYISADRVLDNVTHQESYIVRIRLKDSDSHTVQDLKIKPGMPVEARIVLEERTPLDYLTKPLSSTYVKSFIQE